MGITFAALCLLYVLMDGADLLGCVRIRGLRFRYVLVIQGLEKQLAAASAESAELRAMLADLDQQNYRLACDLWGKDVVDRQVEIARGGRN